MPNSLIQESFSQLPFESFADDRGVGSSLWPDQVAVRCELGAAVEEASRQLASGCLAESIGRFQALYQTGLERQDSELIETASHNLAAAYRQSVSWSTAQTWQQQSVTWRMRRSLGAPSQSLDDLGRLACDLTGRGSDAFLLRDWELAESLWRRALAIEEWRGCVEGQATDSGNLGLLTAMQGRFAEGTRWLRQALRMHRLLLDECAVGTDLLNLAELARLQEDCVRAARLLRLAIQSFTRGEAHALRDLATTRLAEVRRIVSLTKPDPQLN